MSSEAKHTPGPWEYVPSNENHGPYVVGPFGGDIADCYAMSNPHDYAVCNGGTSKPIPFFHEMADPNARLIAAAPELLEALRDTLRMLEAAHRQLGMYTADNPRIVKACAVLAKATGAQK